METPLISLKGVGLRYPMYDSPRDQLKEFLFGRFGKRYSRDFWALRDISFELGQREALGVIGRNGAGKSTLLQVIAGVMPPSVGELHVSGRIASLLELGSGFNPEFTGRENVFLNGAILGFKRKELEARFDQIADFADIGEFMDKPIKIYSSGMFVRLAFAVQACLEPDILIVDEALSVGDVFFQQKCHARIEKLQAQGTAIIIVSHDMASIEKYSTKAMLLQAGKCIAFGRPRDVIDVFHAASYAKPKACEQQHALPGGQSIIDATHGLSGAVEWPSQAPSLDLDKAKITGQTELVRCLRVALCDNEDRPCALFQTGEDAFFYSEYELLQDIGTPMCGVAIVNAKNITLHGKGSLQYKMAAPSILPRGATIRFRQRVRLALAPGVYTFTLGFSAMDQADYIASDRIEYCDLVARIIELMRIREIGSFTIVSDRLDFHGYVDLDGDCSLGIAR